MKLGTRIIVVALIAIIGLFGALTEVPSAEDYASLKGLKSIKAVFDFPDGVPETALIHLKPVQMVLKDKAIVKVGNRYPLFGLHRPTERIRILACYILTFPR